MGKNQKLNEEIIINGFFEEESDYICLYCGAAFNKEEIYPIDQHLYNSIYAVNDHLHKKHGGPLKALLALPTTVSGISVTQKNLMSLLSIDLTDDEIAEQLEISPSTIRNHRFKLREKKRQALYLLSAIELLERVNKKMTAEEVSIATYDDRFMISEEYRKKTLASFLDDNGRANRIPSKEKSKIVLLQYLAESFAENRTYSEKEINQIISEVFDDYVAIRRYLIQYGFLGRTNDGKKYWKL
ncbi:DUF2087 domain-containing protein [Enterococcus sp. LJL128]